MYTDLTEGYTEPFQVQYNTTKHIYSISRATIAVHKMTGSTVHTTPISLMSDEAQQYLTVKLNTGARISPYSSAQTQLVNAVKLTLYIDYVLGI